MPIIRLSAAMLAVAALSPLLAVEWADPAATPIANGPYRPELTSLASSYQTPEWFRDAKFGIWSHWGPQAVPRQGDWYAKRMYQSSRKDKKTGEEKGPDSAYTDHLQRWGHPSEHGYKDLIPLWKAEKWDPEALMARYKKAGAKYFVSMGIHHDNFALWNSPLHRWNAVNMGPQKDVVGLWQAAAKKEGLPFGVSEHLAASYTWFQPSHGADATGPKAGVPYDGNDPKNQDLYHTKAAADDTGWLSKNPAWHAEWYARIRELIDAYHPDLLYSDSGLPFGDVGTRLVAHYYNQSAAANGGTAQVVYNCKQKAEGRWVQDLERGVMDSIQPEPWQTDTSIGDWYYRTGQQYKSATEVIHLLADIVSKNGNLLINVVQTPEGDLEPDMLTILDGIGSWLQVNGEAIYGTRPWKVFGERPAHAAQIKSGGFNEGKVAFTAEDIRFTTSKDGKTLYAIALGRPADGVVRIKSLAKGAPLLSGDLGAVRLLGHSGTLNVTRDVEGLQVTLPTDAPAASAYALAITLP